METTTATTQVAFYREFLMARQSFKPQDFGIDMDKDAFIDQMCEDFNEYVRGSLSVDEMLLRPRTALHFCDSVRAKHLYHDLPDDIILRSVLGRRKHPTA